MKKILIVEDDHKTAMALAIRLKANGYSASIAPDALAGASLARAIKPDLILMDITLPGGDGLQLAESFLRRTETFDIPVIFITASKKPALLKKVMELGAVGLFEKPFDTEKLLNSIGRKFYRMDLLRSGQPSVANKST